MARNYFKHFEALVTKFTKPAKTKKPRKQYTGGKRWTEEERMIVFGLVKLGASDEQISEILSSHSNVRTSKAIEVARCRIFKEMKPGKKYHFVVEL